MVIIFYGNGKGKTSSAIGTVIRALSYGKKVSIIQFLKPGNSGEIKFLKSLKVKNKLNIKSFGKKTFTNPNKLTNYDFRLVKKAINYTKSEISKKLFLLILDEILIALRFKLIDEKRILNIIESAKRNKIHLILTGAYITKTLVQNADIVTQMKNVKHAYYQGLSAIKGLDF